MGNTESIMCRSSRRKRRDGLSEDEGKLKSKTSAIPEPLNAPHNVITGQRGPHVLYLIVSVSHKLSMVSMRLKNSHWN